MNSFRYHFTLSCTDSLSLSFYFFLLSLDIIISLLWNSYHLKYADLLYSLSSSSNQQMLHQAIGYYSVVLDLTNGCSVHAMYGIMACADSIKSQGRGQQNKLSEKVKCCEGDHEKQKRDRHRQRQTDTDRDRQTKRERERERVFIWCFLAIYRLSNQRMWCLFVCLSICLSCDCHVRRQS